MKKQMKKIIALVCAMALAITGIAFVPNAANADDTWIHCDRKTTVPDATPDDPYPEHTCWYLVSSFTGGANGNMDYCWINHDQSSSDPGKIKFRKNYSGLGDDGEPLDLSYGWDIAKLEEYGTDPLHPLSTGKTYKATIKINSSAATEVSSTGKKCKLAVSVFGTAAETTLKAGENTLEVSDIEYDPDDSKKRTIDFNLVQLPLRGEITVTSINIVEDTDAFIPVPDTSSPSDKYGYNPGKDGVNSPWHLRATNNGSTQYGVQGYKFVDGVAANTLPGTLIKLVNTVGEQEKDSQGQPVLPENRWWWTAGILKDYATTAGLQPFTEYTGSITFNTDKETDDDCHLFVYVDGAEYSYELQDGANTLNIPQFMFKGQDNDIKFLFDELPKGAIVSVSNITFTPQSSGGWTTVPNKVDDFTVGPWNMFGFFDAAHPDEGHWGVVQYKENADAYMGYSIKAASVSGWEDAWSCFARLENYCSDYLDEGDQYSMTITLNSSKATVPTAKEDDLDQLLVIVGSEKYYFDLTAGDNVLSIPNQIYKLGQGGNRHEQIMFEMDGLQAGTELTLKDVQINGPNNGWTNVPKNTVTTVGAWTMYAQEDTTHWSKLAYRDNPDGSGMGAYDIKCRRLTPDGSATSMAAMASLKNYLSTAKDTKNRNLSNGEEYGIKLDITTSSQNNSISDYGSLRIIANDQAFDIDLESGKHTYDLVALGKNKMLYNSAKNQSIQFELDEVTAKSIINISNLQLIGPDDESQEVPNGVAYKPEGTPWTLYAITDASSDKYGAMRYEVVGTPSDMSSVRLTLKSVSGWFDARSLRATLNSYLSDLKVNHNYVVTAKVHIDESEVKDEDKHPVPHYDKQLRMIVDEQNFDFDVVDDAQGTYTFESEFKFTNRSKHLAFNFDQMLKGTKIYFVSVDVREKGETTTPTVTTTAPVTSTTAPVASTTKPETSSQVPTSTSETSSEVTTTTKQTPTGDVTTVEPQSTDVTTTSEKKTKKVKAPGKAKIKKIYKRKKSAKKIKVRLKKVKRAKGYQVAVYKTKKKAKKNKKPLVKKYTKKLKVTLKSKKIKKKKKLYVRARAYVLNKKGKKVFGKWSKIKVSKIKKAKKKKRH